MLGSGINVTILNSYNKGDIDQSVAEGYTVSPPIGGVLGFAFVSSIKNSYNQGVMTMESDTEAPAILGGLVGELYFEDWLLDFVISDTGKTFLAKAEGYLLELINNFNIGDIFGRSNSILGGLIGSVEYIYDNFDEEFILSNNWWSNNIANGIGRIRNLEEEEAEVLSDEVEGSFEKESIVEGFKTYSHKVYNTDHDWDFAEIWSNAYEGRGYPVLGFQSILAPSKPSANVSSGTYSSPFSVILSSNGRSIRYTTNGVMPTCSTGILYTSAIQVSSSIVIKAVACDEFDLASVLGQYTYTISSTEEISDTTNVDLIAEYFDIIPDVQDDIEDIVVDDQIPIEKEDIDINDIKEDDVEEKRFNWWWILIVVGVGSLGYVLIKRKKR